MSYIRNLWIINEDNHNLITQTVAYQIMFYSNDIIGISLITHFSFSYERKSMVKKQIHSHLWSHFSWLHTFFPSTDFCYDYFINLSLFFNIYQKFYYLIFISCVIFRNWVNILTVIFHIIDLQMLMCLHLMIEECDSRYLLFHFFCYIMLFISFYLQMNQFYNINSA